jgi:hypothetical protein
LAESSHPTWPLSLRVAFASNVTLPVAFGAALCFAPEAIPSPSALAFTCAFVLPLCFLWLVSRRSSYAVGVHLLGALGMAFLAWNATAHFGLVPALAVVLLGTLQLVLGFVLLSPDVIIPLLAAEKRNWRKHRRMGVNALCRVRTADGEERTCAVRNYSRNGLLIAVVESELVDLVNKLKQSPKVQLTLGSRNAVLEVQVRWTSIQEYEGLLGLEVVGSEGLPQLFPQSLHLDIRLIHKLNQALGVLGKPSLQRLVATLYPLSLAGLLTVTCCGAMDVNEQAQLVQSHQNSNLQESNDDNELPDHVGLMLTYSNNEGRVPEEFEIEIKGCVSGFQKTLNLNPNIQATALRLVRNDVGCIATVKRFKDNDLVFFPESPFDPRVGKSTNFYSKSKNERRLVTVKSQLNNKISGLQSVSFGFSEPATKGVVAMKNLGIPLVGFGAKAISMPEPNLVLVTLSVRGSPRGRLSIPFELGGSAREGKDFYAPQLAGFIVSPNNSPKSFAYIYMRLNPKRKSKTQRILTVTLRGGNSHVVENPTTSFVIPHARAKKDVSAEEREDQEHEDQEREDHEREDHEREDHEREDHEREDD